MSKEKPILFKSDILEMYDRHKMNLFDLAAIAHDKDCNINIHIRPDGFISFEGYEVCGNVTYYKTLTQTEKSVAFQEMEIRD